MNVSSESDTVYVQATYAGHSGSGQSSSGPEYHINVNIVPPPPTTPPTPTPPPLTPTNLELKGYVLDLVTGAPVNGATVTSGGRTTTSDAGGYFSFGTVPAGTHVVNASKGWKVGSATFTLPDFGDATANVVRVFAGFQTGGLTDPFGRFTSNYAYTSPDGGLTLSIPAGTQVLLPGGGAAGYIAVEQLADGLSLPPLVVTVSGVNGTAYSIGPAGLSFSQPVTLTLRYDPARLPAGYNASHLRVGLYEPETGQWWGCYGGWVDEAAHTVSARLLHASAYAVLYTANPYALPPATATTTTSEETTAATTATQPSTTATATTQASDGMVVALAAFALGAAAVVLSRKAR